MQGDRLSQVEERPVDAAILAQLLRADLLPEAWIAPPAVRQLRALLRHRASLVRLGTQLRNRIHAVAADHGYDRTGSYWTGPGRGWLAELDLPVVSREIVTDCLAFTGALAPAIERLDGELHQHAKADPRVKVLRTLPGAGEFTALVLLAGAAGRRSPPSRSPARSSPAPATCSPAPRLQAHDAAAPAPARAPQPPGHTHRPGGGHQTPGTLAPAA